MQMTFKFFFSFLFCLGLLIVSGCISEAQRQEREAKQQEQEQKRTAFSYVKTLASAVERFAVDVGRPPTTREGFEALVSRPPDVPEHNWQGPYILERATSLDPWGNNYQYANPGDGGRAFDIWTNSPDGIIGHWMNDI